MKWISSAAKQFHHLMQAQTDRMERELNAIAGWVGKNDTVPWWEDPLK